MKNAIVYLSKSNKLINGSLFYAFEYYLYLKQFYNALEFLVIVDDESLDVIKKIMLDKYHDGLFNENEICNVNILKLRNYDNIITFDSNTFMNIRPLTKAFLISYANEDILYENSNCKLFNYYDYQKAVDAIKTPLRLGLQFQKRYLFDDGKLFYSFPKKHLVNIEIPDEALTKNDMLHHKKLFKSISHVTYIHTGLDKNNRIIVEGFYHNKVVKFIEESKIIDSAVLRFNDININYDNIKNYTISDDCLMIQYIKDKLND